MPLNHTSQFAELTDGQFQLIGKIVVEWANIEFLQKLILSRLLFSSDFLSRTYTVRMSAVKVHDAIKEIVEYQRKRYLGRIFDEDILSEIEKVNTEINSARIHRNKFAHFCWTRNTDEEIFGTNFSAGLPDTKKHNKSFIVVKNSELEQLYNESYELVDKISQILEKLPEIKVEDLVKSKKNEPGITH